MTSPRPPSSSSPSPSSSSPAHLSLDWASEHGTPVFLTLWDFVPPGMTASLAMILGLGIWHSQLWIPDMNIELAFGGHDEDDLTGIFTIPRDPYSFLSPSSSLPCLYSIPSQQYLIDGLSHAFARPDLVPSPGPSALPAARYVGCWFVGYAGAVDEDEVAGGKGIGSGSVQGPLKKTGRWAAPQSGRSAYRELLFSPFDTTSNQSSSKSWSSLLFQEADTLRKTWLPSSSSSSAANSSSKDGSQRSAVGQGQPLLLEIDRKHPRHTGVRARSAAFVMRVIQELKQDPEWHGLRYDVLNHNCNHFSALLLERLTGAKLPTWINRSAGLGRTFANYIPSSLLDLQTDAPGEMPDDDEEKEDDQQEHGKESSLAARVVQEELTSAKDKPH
ncbi:unnamed protein product [Tilletia controversa]|uniref:Uncharacterized protein n=3 Tax=Tilletia TaxID=13289 RepID=A0A177U705_9BASI|nr:hypothetical protein CF336_g5462 [Tilletia laevis]KAE8196836.1 hypothetical protein CF335_g4759 [Tilletia laevis]KAE8257216.1 hypothetical protein A4X03_0g4742 [Tilletia caries]CAD6909144.1 unnamed protein product [Tilletia controversa]